MRIRHQSETHLENLAGDALELLGRSVALHVVGQLVEGHLGPGGIVHEPVGSSAHSGSTHVYANNHVSEHKRGLEKNVQRKIGNFVPLLCSNYLSFLGEYGTD